MCAIRGNHERRRDLLVPPSGKYPDGTMNPAVLSYTRITR